ncbi:hypothetical protein [Streptomyces sp. S.PB5]|uniref:hypothetical protein n=1 Tax=Streptomyces sp. S.PB5 TaxID=3020844 RepID=UPI0025B15420|nr:hypothetical protein [Streptomyces sp. S.PB5]MDN3028551.1 hypothetical protein [Streptomyces sp. S.PB5]
MAVPGTMLDQVECVRSHVHALGRCRTDDERVALALHEMRFFSTGVRILGIYPHARTELWADRDAEQLTTWLRTHPGVEVVCGDGSLVYRQGITDGAPDAVQVSNCFHLWQGLSKRIADIASIHCGCLHASIPPPEPAPVPTTAPGPSHQADTPARRRAKRLFEAVHAVTDTGCTLSAQSASWARTGALWPSAPGSLPGRIA